MPANPTTAQEFCANQITRRANKMAADLRRLAEAIELEATRGVANVGKPGWPSYASVAATIQHEVMTVLMNLHVDALTTDACEADTARLKGE